MNLPVGDFPILTAFYGFAVLPDGAKPKEILSNPIGTGPWKYESFKPGARSVFTANRNYWVHDGPYIDELTDRLELHRGVRATELAAQRPEPGDAGDAVRARAPPEGVGADQAARGHRHVVPVLRDAHRRGPVQGRAGAAGAAAARGPPGVRRPDPQRIRRAGRRPPVPRREVLRRGVQARAGRRAGQVAAQGGGAGEPHGAARHLQRPRRPGRRVDALPAAGQAGRGRRQDQPDRSGHLLQRDAGPLAELPVLGEFWVNGTASLALYYLNVLSRDAPYNETAGRTPPPTSCCSTRSGRSTRQQAQEKWREVQRLQFDEGGYLVYANQTYVDGLAKEVNGIEPSKAAWLGGFELHDAWLA